MAAIDVEFSEIDSKYVNKLISTTGIVYSLNNPKPRFNTALFECKWCHGKYHSYYGKHATPRSLIKFLNRFGSVRL